MRICLVSQEYPPETSSGGIGSQTYAKAHGLVSLGHEVCVVSANSTEEVREYREGPVRVVRIPGGFHPRMSLNTEPVRWLAYSAEVAATLSQLHSRTPFDIIDFPEYGGEGYIYLLNRTQWDFVPAVVHLHGPLVMFAHTMGWPEVDSELYRTGTAMESACFRLADAVYSSSQCSAAWCARHYGMRRGPIPTIHTGVDLHLFKPAAAKHARRTIIFVGRVNLHKGVESLVDAACALAGEFPDLRLRILGTGDPEFLQSLRDKSLKCGKPDLIEFVGYVQRRELPAYLSEADVFAAPSVYEGGPGFVYLEAMACGLPVIACKGSGASEIVRQGRNGFLVAPRDQQALVRALRQVLSNNDLRRFMGLNARRFVEAEADTGVCLERLEAFYTSVAQRDKRKNRQLQRRPKMGWLPLRRSKTAGIGVSSDFSKPYFGKP